MATVYLAEDIKHERNVAFKVLKPELAAVVGAERFLAEIKTTANLSHPHILPLHDSGEADSFVFYVMPYVQGESLRDRLEREHQLPVEDAVRIATNVAEAMDYAHRQGVMHRDIKPANVLLLDGKPVISDFGIALAVGAAGGASHRDRPEPGHAALHGPGVGDGGRLMWDPPPTPTHSGVCSTRCSWETHPMSGAPHRPFWARSSPSLRPPKPSSGRRFPRMSRQPSTRR
jgi:serine/threonine protein kinase